MPRFANDFYERHERRRLHAGPDGFPDDVNGDNVPDLYPSLYPSIFSPTNTRVS